MSYSSSYPEKRAPAEGPYCVEYCYLIYLSEYMKPFEYGTYMLM